MGRVPSIIEWALSIVKTIVIDISTFKVIFIFSLESRQEAKATFHLSSFFESNWYKHIAHSFGIVKTFNHLLYTPRSSRTLLNTRHLRRAHPLPPTLPFTLSFTFSLSFPPSLTFSLSHTLSLCLFLLTCSAEYSPLVL